MNFLFKVEDPDKTVKDAAEAASARDHRRQQDRYRPDQSARAASRPTPQKTLQAILDKYGIRYGRHFSAIAEKYHPPKPVQAAFKDVASAREDRNKYINQAEGYRNDILPKAKGEAAQYDFQSPSLQGRKSGTRPRWIRPDSCRCWKSTRKPRILLAKDSTLKPWKGCTSAV